MTTELLDLQDYGRRILTGLHAAIRALKLYPLENEAVQQALRDLHQITADVLTHEGTIELRVVGDFFFLNETRLRLDLSNFSTVGAFAQMLSGHGIGAVEVMHGVEQQEWAPFLSVLLKAGSVTKPFEAFQGWLAATPVQFIQVRAIEDIEEQDVEEEGMQAAKRTYSQSVNAAQEALGDMRLGKAVNVRKVKRAVQGIVDQVLTNETSMVTMTTLRDFDEYTFTHCVNVCIFSVVIGQRLGLTKLQLYELGLGALFHDVGKSRIDEEIINKPSGLTDEEWKQLQEHPTEGLLILFTMLGFADVPYRQMLIAYEHHMKVDVSGYPTHRRTRTPTLFSRIVAVADGFDAGTSVRSYQFNPWPPDEVLKEMRDNPKRGFDQLLVKVLMNSTGVYPIGTLVILDSMELAVVSAVNQDPEKLHQPTVRIISDGMGMPLAKPLTADLSERDPRTGTQRRSIIKTTDPTKYGVRVADYLI